MMFKALTCKRVGAFLFKGIQLSLIYEQKLWTFLSATQ